MAALLPPLLPTVFTMSVGVSDNRLSKKNIACSNSEDILVAGKVTKAFFDKTGTLTRQGLDFVSAKCRETWKNCDPSTATMVSADLTMGMACCHGLTMSQGDILIGNPVDRTMFEASGGRHIGEGGGSNHVTVEDRNGNTIDIVKKFDFDHHRMTQSVICKKSDGTYVAFVKGSGESLEKLCTSDSLPRDFGDAVRESAKEATYQITMASKVISPSVVNSITRDEIEKDLLFVGVINFKNILRPETAGVISHLEEGEVQCIMVTGDSIHTGIRIAKECGLVSDRVLLCTSTDPSSGEFTWVDESDATVSLPAMNDFKTGAAGCQLAMSGTMWAKLLDQSPAVATELAPFIRVYGRCVSQIMLSCYTEIT
jgi:magnesium-transporting ATPase (P-type)